jgi:RNA polymerase sigma-70 factor (ECF subfamily)
MKSPVGPSGERAAGPSAQEERELVGRAAGGDTDAFRELVERHRDRTYGLALRIVRSPRDAEEVAQDAFVRAWHGLPRFRGEAAFSTWLFRIAVRLAFDRAAALRGRSRLESGSEPAADIASAPASGPDPDRTRVLEALVASLPEAQRAVVTLFYYQDRSVKDVASALGLNENTVKTHLARARAALRSAWLRRGGGVA